MRSSSRCIVFIRLTVTLTEEAVGSLVGATLPSSPRLGGRARNSGGPARPDVRERAGCAHVGWCPIWRKFERSPKPTQRARRQAALFNENMLDDNAIWPWGSGIGYVFSIHCYVDFPETDKTCYIHYYITNHN